MSAPRQVIKIAGDAVLAEHAVLDGLHDVARRAARPCPRIDKDRGAAHRFVVRLSRVGREAADEIDVAARLQPFAAEDRLRRQGRAGDDVRFTGDRLTMFETPSPLAATSWDGHYYCNGQLLGISLYRSEEHTSAL